MNIKIEIYEHDHYFGYEIIVNGEAVICDNEFGTARLALHEAKEQLIYWLRDN